jgi:hypothetical protein
VSVTKSAIESWPIVWASESIKTSQQPFEGLAFTGDTGNSWKVSLDQGYDMHADNIKQRQIVLGGARLAQLLRTVWP